MTGKAKARRKTPTTDEPHTARKRCPCGARLTLQEDVSVRCKCGRAFTLRVTRRLRGSALTAGFMRLCRKALADFPDACKACEGTGFRRPAAVERAAVVAMAKGRTYNPQKDCPRCGGTGTRSR